MQLLILKFKIFKCLSPRIEKNVQYNHTLNTWTHVLFNKVLCFESLSNRKNEVRSKRNQKRRKWELSTTMK